MALANLTEIARRVLRVSNAKSNTVFESASAPYHCQPETVAYRDPVTGTEVTVLAWPKKEAFTFSQEYGTTAWSSDGKRLGLFGGAVGVSVTRASQNPAYPSAGSMAYRRFVIYADGSNFRLASEGAGHGGGGDGGFGWMRTVANAAKYLAFGSASTESTSTGTLYQQALAANNTPTRSSLIDTETASGGDDLKFPTLGGTVSAKSLLKRPISPDDSLLVATAANPANYGAYQVSSAIIGINLTNNTISFYWPVARNIAASYGTAAAPHIGAVLVNGGFDTDLSGWSDASSGGGAVAWSGGTAVFTGGGGTASLRQSFTATARQYVPAFALTALTGGGTFTFKVGTTAGASDILSAAFTTNGVKYSNNQSPSLLFTPSAGTVHISLEYTGGTSVVLDSIGLGNELKHHGGGAWAIDGTHMILLYSAPATDGIFWKLKMAGSASDGGPLWEAYNATTQLYGADDIRPFASNATNIPSRVDHPNWGHPTFSPSGLYLIHGDVSDTAGLTGARLVRTSDGAPLLSLYGGNLSDDLGATPEVSYRQYDGRHHAWDAWCDSVVFFPLYVGAVSNQQRILYGRGFSTITGMRTQAYPICETYAISQNTGTGYNAYPRPSLSPDGTKVAFHTELCDSRTPIVQPSGSSIGDWSDVSSGTGSTTVSNGDITLTAGASGIGAIEYSAAIHNHTSASDYSVEFTLVSGTAPTVQCGSTTGATDVLTATAATQVASLGTIYKVLLDGRPTNGKSTLYFRINKASSACVLRDIRIFGQSYPTVAWAVCYYPKPPAMTGATKNAGNVRLAFTAPIYNPTTGNDAPKEIKGYHVWSTTDSMLQTGWTELTTSAVTGTTYDYAQTVGTTRYYALTTEEHSRLESDYLSNVWSVTLDGAGTITSQMQQREEGQRDWWTTAPSAPMLAASSFAAAAVNTLSWTVPADTTKIKCYNIYYSSVGAPATTADNRIASIPPTYFDASNVEQNHTTWKDWLHDTSATAYYAMTSVDRYGNETGVTRVSLPSTRERHRMQPFSAAARPAASARPPKN